MGDIICKKCGSVNPPITRQYSKEENGVVKIIRVIDKDTRCGLCGGEIEWTMS